MKLIFGILIFLSILLQAQSQEKKIDYYLVSSGFLEITDIQFLPKVTNKLVVLQKKGLGFIYDINSKEKKNFLNLEKNIVANSELGLLGLAFHPNFDKNSLFYVNYNQVIQEKYYTIIGEFKNSNLNMTTVTKPERILLKVEQPYSNHNAGQLVFGSDGYLYIGFGDGGSANDPFGHGQNTKTFLGSLIRIDVTKSANTEYTIPKDNPFVGQKDYLEELWAFGFRNPWRFSFDQKKNRLILADVGQNQWEEIDLVEKGKNYGWNIREGNHNFSKNQLPKKELIDPVFEYSHSMGSSITGGYVYYGKNQNLFGKYIYADFVSGRIWALNLDNLKKAENILLFETKYNISTFGQDSNGELYFGDYTSGSLFKIY